MTRTLEHADSDPTPPRVARVCNADKTALRIGQLHELYLSDYPDPRKPRGSEGHLQSSTAVDLGALRQSGVQAHLRL